MANLSTRRKKERFLKTVESVDKDTILSYISSTAVGEDIYTRVVTENAFNTGFVDDKKLNDFALKFYSDWYFLAKNTGYKTPSSVKIFGEYEFSPVSMINDKCIEVIKSNTYKDIFPLFVQYINKLEDKFFLCVDINKLYCRGEEKEYPVRLYINLPSSASIDFASEFLDRSYLLDIAGVIKILSDDSRFDTITIYTDYQSVDSVVELINTIKEECPSIFTKVGKLSPLLGKFNDVIGFGEQYGKDTYLNTRCRVLSTLKDLASREVLKNLIVGVEKPTIGTKRNGQIYTPTEYLEYLISNNARMLAEEAIDKIEATGEEDSERLEVLYTIREDGRNGFDFTGAVNELKKCISSFTPFSLKIKDCGQDNFDYLGKLFRLFSTASDNIISTPSNVRKKNIVSSKIFTLSENMIDVSTEKFLYDYFKTELAESVNNLIIERMNGMTKSDSEVLRNLKTKSCENLRRLLMSIIDDGVEGKEYIYNCVYDYVRILSTDCSDRVSVDVNGRHLIIDKDINSDIVSLIPQINDNITNLTHNTEFIDKKLIQNGINPMNMCLSDNTKDIHKESADTIDNNADKYYYNPEGYLSTSATM